MLNMMQTIATKAHTHISAPEAPSMTFFFWHSLKHLLYLTETHHYCGFAEDIEIQEKDKLHKARRKRPVEWFLIEYPSAMKRGLHKM
jgi:hypothetical protein